MATTHIPIHRLPTNVTPRDAVEMVYREALGRIDAGLRRGESIRVQCDPPLTALLIELLASGASSAPGTRPLVYHVASGDRASVQPNTGPGLCRVQSVLSRIRASLDQLSPGDVLVVPDLELFFSAAPGPAAEALLELRALLCRYPGPLCLGFYGPDCQVPDTLADLLPRLVRVGGVPREHLFRIVTQAEAKKLGGERLNFYTLHRYVSGLNAIRCRQVLSRLTEKADRNVRGSPLPRQVYADIREATCPASVSRPSIEFDRDIGGYKQVRELLRRTFLEPDRRLFLARDSHTVERLESICPRGMVLHGPAGIGKSLVAKAVATALDAAMVAVPGVELTECAADEGLRRLKRAFVQARRAAPSVLWIRELDMLAVRSSSRQPAASTPFPSPDESSEFMEDQLLEDPRSGGLAACLISEIAQLGPDERVVVIGSTRHIDRVPQPLLRPGYLEVDVLLPYPDANDRRAILELYLRRYSLSPASEELDYLIEKTGSFFNDGHHFRCTGGRLHALVRALAREHLGRGADRAITKDEIDRVLGSGRQRPVQLNETEKRMIAIHKAGHVLCAYLLPRVPSIERVSLATDMEETVHFIDRVMRLRNQVTTRSELLDAVCVLLAGRTAEQLLLGDVSIGSSHDLQRATEICRMMAEDFGMSEPLGPRTYGRMTPDVGHTFVSRHPVSEAVAARIDEELDRLLHAQHKRAGAKLTEHRDQLERLVAVLLQKKYADSTIVKSIFAGKVFD